MRWIGLKKYLLISNMSEKWTKPGPISFEVSTCSETAFQRAIFRCKENYFEDFGHVKWLDMELPVDGQRRGRGHCVDLIGRLDDMTMILCELKFGKPGNGCPQEAKEQIEEYYASIKENIIRLEEGDPHHTNANGEFKWRELTSKDTIRIIAANSDYWAYWRKKGKPIPKDTRCYSLEVATDYFIRQKAKAATEKYTPEINHANWKIVSV